MATTQSDARIFLVKTRFQEIAQLPPRVSRDQALARAEAHVESMKPESVDLFRTKLREVIAAAEQLCADPADPSRLEEAYQNSGQLQDIAKIAGFDIVSAISGNLCEILDTIKAGAAYHKETIDCYVSAISLASKPSYSNLQGDQLAEMNASLLRLVERTRKSLPKPSNPAEESAAT